MNVLSKDNSQIHFLVNFRNHERLYKKSPNAGMKKYNRKIILSMRAFTKDVHSQGGEGLGDCGLLMKTDKGGVGVQSNGCPLLNNNFHVN